jgi:BlaI family transcriptional regulator, penicillinase repressor
MRWLYPSPTTQLRFDGHVEKLEDPMSGKRMRVSQDQLPTASELRLCQILWERGAATVEDILNAHSAKERPNYKTVQALLRIMERKGFIAHEIRGRAFVFKPLISRKTIDQRSVQSLLLRNFRGSATGLFLNLLEAAKVKEKDLDELEAQIREYRGKKSLGGRR